MDQEDAISISSNGSEDEQYIDRRVILEPAIRSVVDALGGYEGGSYRLGDECYGCLKDLKKFWRKDDTDDDRTVARIFWETRLLPNDLVPILLETAGKGLLEDRCAIACADLMTAMTWPIDLAEELKELDEEYDKGADYTQLLLSHLNYKATLLRPGVMQALFGIMLPCLAKSGKERKERDVQIINVILHLIRNLAFIKDLPPNMHLSADQAEYSTLQSRLIKVLSDTNTFDLLLTIASNATTDIMFNGWNALVLEIFYLLFRGVKPSALAMDQVKVRSVASLGCGLLLRCVGLSNPRRTYSDSSQLKIRENELSHGRRRRGTPVSVPRSLSRSIPKRHRPQTRTGRMRKAKAELTRNCRARLFYTASRRSTTKLEVSWTWSSDSEHKRERKSMNSVEMTISPSMPSSLFRILPEPSSRLVSIVS